ncbi:hypothetical protein [Micromonospora sp. NPDC126480]
MAEYRVDWVALLIYLGTLQAEAAGHLDRYDAPDLTDRFIAWARPR